MGEPSLSIKVDYFSRGVSWFRVLDIGECTAITHKHQVVELCTVKAQEFTRTVS